MMHRPVLVTSPSATPVTLAEAKAHLRVDFADDDALITAMIGAATGYLDGWTGILGGVCLVDQVWRQDFDLFAKCMPLPLGPVTEIVSVKWLNSAGTETTIAAASYSLETDAGGRSFVRFKDDFTVPSDLYESAAVSIQFKAGHAAEAVPAAIKAAILLHVGHLYENREAVSVGSTASMLPFAYDQLITPYRKLRI
jgi:uncharacterized phiE125 gp8 family phage protein